MNNSICGSVNDFESTIVKIPPSSGDAVEVNEENIQNPDTIVLMDEEEYEKTVGINFQNILTTKRIRKPVTRFTFSDDHKVLDDYSSDEDENESDLTTSEILTPEDERDLETQFSP